MCPHETLNQIKLSILLRECFQNGLRLEIVGNHLCHLLRSHKDFLLILAAKIGKKSISSKFLSYFWVTCKTLC